MPKHNASHAIRPVMVAAAFVLATAIAANAIVVLGRSAPHMGDIVAFTPSASLPTDDNTQLIAHRAGRGDCTLDLSVLRRSGGSLVVDAQPVGQAVGLGVHWAGARTSDDASNCGNDADLVVGHSDMNILALSAGGYGVGSKRAPIVASDIGFSR